MSRLRSSSARVVRGVYLALALIAMPALASAQGSIGGTVRNASTTAPISGVTVVALRINTSFTFSAVTDASGVYNITSLPAGIYVVYTSNGPSVSPGYANQILASGSIFCIGSCLAIDAITLGTQVVVSGSAVAGK